MPLGKTLDAFIMYHLFIFRIRYCASRRVVLCYVCKFVSTFIVRANRIDGGGVQAPPNSSSTARSLFPPHFVSAFNTAPSLNPISINSPTTGSF